jgi:hypothetical protein
MARSNNNATNGIRGQIDQIVFKSRAGTGKTLTTKVPDMSNVVPSEAQSACRIRFKLAARFAKAKLEKPGMNDYYLTKVKPGQTTYNVVWKEFWDALTNGEDVNALMDALPALQISPAVNACTRHCDVPPLLVVSPARFRPERGC